MFRYNYISLPIVEYEVDEQIYEVIEPKFKVGIKTTNILTSNKVISEEEYNIKSKEELSDVVH